MKKTVTCQRWMNKELAPMQPRLGRLFLCEADRSPVLKTRLQSIRCSTGSSWTSSEPESPSTLSPLKKDGSGERLISRRGNDRTSRHGAPLFVIQILGQRHLWSVRYSSNAARSCILQQHSLELEGASCPLFEYYSRFWKVSRVDKIQ